LTNRKIRNLGSSKAHSILKTAKRKRSKKSSKKHDDRSREMTEALVTPQKERKLVESEQKFRSLVEDTAAGVAAADLTGRLTYVNKALGDLLGYSVQELSGRSFADFLHPADRERVMEVFIQGISSSRQAPNIEFRAVRKDASIRYLWSRPTRLAIEGKTVGFEAIIIDITERKHMEDKLQRHSEHLGELIFEKTKELSAARERLEYVISSNPAVIYAGKPNADCSDFFLTYLSERVASMLGFEPREFIGHPEFWERHVHPEDVRSVMSEMPRLWKEGQHTFEYRFLHKDGTYRWIREEAKVVRDANGNPVEVNGYWTDITEEKRMQEALLRSERLAAVGEMATMMAHDLRNPLTGISGAAYHLRKKLGATADRKSREMLDLIEKDVEHANRIMCDLLEYSRELHLDLAGTSPRSIIEQALALVEIPSEVRVSNLTNDQPEVRMDTEKMKRVFVNLIRNAVDAMSQGGELTIQSKKSNGNLQVTFSDTGTGITEDVASRIWMPFFTTKAKGIGLGLSISKRIVEAHKGHISYETKIGKGTTFTVTIPSEARNHD